MKEKTRGKERTRRVEQPTVCCSQIVRYLGLEFSMRNFKVFLQQIPQKSLQSRCSCILGRVGGSSQIGGVGQSRAGLWEHSIPPVLCRVPLTGSKDGSVLACLLGGDNGEAVRPHSISQSAPPDTIPQSVPSAQELACLWTCFPCNCSL